MHAFCVLKEEGSVAVESIVMQNYANSVHIYIYTCEKLHTLQDTIVAWACYIVVLT